MYDFYTYVYKFLLPFRFFVSFSNFIEKQKKYCIDKEKKYANE